MDYPYGKFADCIFSRFGSIVRTVTQTDSRGFPRLLSAWVVMCVITTSNAMQQPISATVAAAVSAIVAATLVVTIVQRVFTALQFGTCWTRTCRTRQPACPLVREYFPSLRRFAVKKLTKERFIYGCRLSPNGLSKLRVIVYIASTLSS